MTPYKDQKLKTIRSFLAFMGNSGAPEWPLEVFLELSNVCNLSCAMCGSFSALNPNRQNIVKSLGRGTLDFNDKEFLGKISSVFPHVLNAHCFGFGEPLVHPQFKDWLAHVTHYEIMADFYTNGMKITEELATHLVNSNVYRVVISFSGATKKDYENVYLGGHLETVLKNIGHLVRAKQNSGKKYPLVTINSVSFKHHVESFDKFVIMMGMLGVDTINTVGLVDYSFAPELKGHRSDFKTAEGIQILENARAIAEKFGVELSFQPDLLPQAGRVEGPRPLPTVKIEDFKNRAGKIVQEKSTSNETVKTSAVGLQDAVELAHRMLEIQKPATEAPLCPQPFSSMYVSQSGKVRPCCLWPDKTMALGDLNDGSLQDVWRGAGFETLRRGMARGEFPKLSCQECTQYKLTPPSTTPLQIIREYILWRAHCFNEPPLMDLPPVRPLHVINKADSAVIKKEDVVNIAGRLPWSSLQNLGFLEGQIDVLNEEFVSGWIWSPVAPNEHLTLTFWEGDRFLGEAVSSNYRKDLADAGKGDGAYGFHFILEGVSVSEVKVRIGHTPAHLESIS